MISFGKVGRREERGQKEKEKSCFERLGLGLGSIDRSVCLFGWLFVCLHILHVSCPRHAHVTRDYWEREGGSSAMGCLQERGLGLV